MPSGNQKKTRKGPIREFLARVRGVGLMRTARVSGVLFISLPLWITFHVGGARQTPVSNSPQNQAARPTNRQRDLQRASDCINARDFELAESLLQSLLKENSGDAQALTLLGKIRAREGNSSDAERLFRAAIESSPDVGMAHENLAQLLESLGRSDDALHEYELALAADPKSDVAKRGLGAVAEKDALAACAKGDRAEALGILLEARKAAPLDPRILVDLGLLELEMGLNQDAVHTLQEGHSSAPNDSQMLYGLARAELVLQDMPSAERHMREYLAQRPQDPTAHYGLGKILRMLERSHEAESEFQLSISFQPRQTASYYELGDLALNSGDLDTASQQFKEVLARDPNHGGALTGMGIIDYRQKRYDAANDFLKRAIAQSPDYQPAHYYYALDLKRLGRTEESDREMHIALDLDAQAKAKKTQRSLILESPGSQSTPPSPPR